MPANGRGGSLKAGFTESATENEPPGFRRFRAPPGAEAVVGSGLERLGVLAFKNWVRVKRCGKSAPRPQ